MLYDKDDLKRYNYLRDKYGTTTIPEPKVLTEKEIEESLIKQQEMDHQAIVRYRKNDERLSRRYARH